MGLMHKNNKHILEIFSIAILKATLYTRLIVET